MRLIESEGPAFDESRAILGDIVDDDKRAGEVIRNVRGMFQREPTRMAPLDINEVVGEIVR